MLRAKYVAAQHGKERHIHCFHEAYCKYDSPSIRKEKLFKCSVQNELNPYTTWSGKNDCFSKYITAFTFRYKKKWYKIKKQIKFIFQSNPFHLSRVASWRNDTHPSPVQQNCNKEKEKEKEITARNQQHHICTCVNMHGTDTHVKPMKRTNSAAFSPPIRCNIYLRISHSTNQ